MKALINLFPKKGEIVEKLKENVTKLYYKKIFFEHLGPELKKLFDKRKDVVNFKNFYDASQYEYGFFDKEIDLLKAYLLYKKYADHNDILCMYKMHVIHLCEYTKFHVPFSRVLEKMYLLKCFAYLPNYVYQFDLKLFEKIDVTEEITEMISIEDESLEKHKLFFELLNKERQRYNLTENDIILMKNTFFGFFFNNDDDDDNEDIKSLSFSFSVLNSMIPRTQLDYAYYTAKNKCIYFGFWKNLISESEIEKFYKEIENKKLYEFYCDYGNYLLEIKDKINPKIIEIFTKGYENGHTFCNIRLYHSIITYYDFYEIMNNYDKAEILLDCLLDYIVFKKMMLSQFILLMGYLIKYSKFSKKIISKYLIYIKEINDFITPIIKKKEKQKEIKKDKENNYFLIKAYIYYIGFKGIEEQNLKKAIEYFEKAKNYSDDIYFSKTFEYFKYKAKQILNNNKLIPNDELVKAKKDLFDCFSKNSTTKNEILDYYILAEDYLEGITRKKDEFIAFKIFETIPDLFCTNIIDSLIKHEICQFLKNHKNKTEYKLKDEICCICYEKKVDKLFIPCKHNFCSICAPKLEKDSTCPICRAEILVVV